MPKKLVTIYGRDACVYCIRACQYLAQRGIAYDYRNLTKDPLLTDEFNERTKGAVTVPQVFIGEEHIGTYEALVAMPLVELQAKVAGS
jgi:glutaredoxin 3